jgi:hypothetical protein
MNKILKPVALCAGLVVAICLADAFEAPLRFGFVRDAEAIIGVAPGGSVARRHAIVATEAVVTTTAVAATSANANAAAAANANAQAAAAAAAKPPPPAPAPGAPPPVGTIVTTLPPGCVETDLNGVAYQRCGSTYYRASMMGSNLVFVVSQP